MAQAASTAWSMLFATYPSSYHNACACHTCRCGYVAPDHSALHKHLTGKNKMPIRPKADKDAAPPPNKKTRVADRTPEENNRRLVAQRIYQRVGVPMRKHRWQDRLPSPSEIAPHIGDPHHQLVAKMHDGEWNLMGCWMWRVPGGQAGIGWVSQTSGLTCLMPLLVSDIPACGVQPCGLKRGMVFVNLKIPNRVSCMNV